MKNLRLEDLSKKDVITLFRMWIPEPPENVIAAFMIMDLEAKAVALKEMMTLASIRMETETPHEIKRIERRKMALANRYDKIRSVIKGLTERHFGNVRRVNLNTVTM